MQKCNLRSCMADAVDLFELEGGSHRFWHLKTPPPEIPVSKCCVTCYQAVEGLLNAYLASLGKSLTAALDSRKLASEVGGSVSGLLGGPGGARAAGASLKVQVRPLHREPVPDTMTARTCTSVLSDCICHLSKTPRFPTCCAVHSLLAHCRTIAYSPKHLCAWSRPCSEGENSHVPAAHHIRQRC